MPELKRIARGLVPALFCALLGAFCWGAFSTSMRQLGFGDGTYGVESGTLALLFLYVPLRELLRAGLVSEMVRTRILGARPQIALRSAAGFGSGELLALVFTHDGQASWWFRGLLETAVHMVVSVWLLRSGASRGRAGGLPSLAKVALGVAALRIPLSYLLLSRGFLVASAAAPLIAAVAIGLWLSVQHDMSSLAPNSIRQSLMARVPSLPELRREVAAQRAAVRPTSVVLGIPMFAGALVSGIAIAAFSAKPMGYNLAAVDESNLRSLPALLWILLIVLGFYAFAGVVHRAAFQSQVMLEAALASALSFVLVWALVGVSGVTALLICMILSPLCVAAACVGAWTTKKRATDGAMSKN